MLNGLLPSLSSFDTVSKVQDWYKTIPITSDISVRVRRFHVGGLRSVTVPWLAKRF